jgi:hypothetical protein
VLCGCPPRRHPPRTRTAPPRGTLTARPARSPATRSRRVHPRNCTARPAERIKPTTLPTWLSFRCLVVARTEDSARTRTSCSRAGRSRC